MYVVKTGLAWADHPDLYAVEGIIAYDGEIAAILEDGFTEAVIDTEKGKAPVNEAANDLAAKLGDRQGKSVSFKPLREELRVARVLQREAVIMLKDIARSINIGREPDYGASQGLVERMMDSVTRNGSALLALSKLRGADEYTFNHCLSVSVLAMIFGQYMDLDSQEVMQLGLSGLLHDLGKFDVPLKVLNKPGKLSPEEFEVMKQHPKYGYKRLAAVENIDKAILPGVLYHHERYDGQGYPIGVGGDDLPLVAQVVGMADVYDALTSRRVYKAAMLPAKAMSLMYSMRKQNFDPKMLEHFVCCLGVYPIGSFVRLSDNRCGVVTETSTGTATKPMVRVVRDSEGDPMLPQDVDLSAHPELSIAACLDPVDSGVDPSSVLLSTA